MIGENNLKDNNIWEDAIKDKQRESTTNVLERWLIVIGSASTGTSIQK